MNLAKSEGAFQEACRYMPGGVNSPVRSFNAVGGSPVFIDRGNGSKIWDIDGNEYIDFCASWGPLILGHAHPDVMRAISGAIQKGTTFGAPTILETELARRIVAAVPSIEKVRFVNSGTEAVMSAVRLARAFTGRTKIVKFDGCYHGHADHLLVSAGSGLATLSTASSAGVPSSFAAETISIPFNDEIAIRQVFETYKDQIAAVIVEPVPANMGVVLPRDGFLELLRQLTIDNNALLIFDEVITGFRLGFGGAQELFGVTPDLTTLGKIIGGGLPVGAYGGRADIMDLISPSGPVYQAGTLSGNPAAMSAGIATLDILSTPDFYSKLNEKSAGFVAKLRAIFPGNIVNSIGSMFTLFFINEPVVDYQSARGCDLEQYARFFHAALSAGLYLAPSQFEANFISVVHAEDVLEKTTDVFSWISYL